MVKTMIGLMILVISLLCTDGLSTAAERDNPLGVQATRAVGEKRLLVAAVTFPDARPGKPIEELKKRIMGSLNTYIQEQSYGQTSVKVDFRGWVPLPDPLDQYKVSPYNFQVDKKKVRKLIEDTLSMIEKEAELADYDQILIIPGVHTTPGQGYGMICYCANPGMLSGVSKRYVPRFETVRSKKGKEFQGGILVSAENAHLGMFAHDYLHTLGGVQDGKRIAPCLYDFERQSDAKAGLPAFENHAIYMGPWDIMSQHLVKQGQPCPGLSSFTKIRLGWILPEKVLFVEPGKTAHAFLTPLAHDGEKLVIKIPLRSSTYYLIENRQPTGYDQFLPDTGILILKVNLNAPEGYGQVQVMNADPMTKNFYRATFKPGVKGRNIYLDKENDIAVLPLWEEGRSLGVLVTSKEKSGAALKAVAAIMDLMKKEKGPEKREKVLKALSAFKAYDFEQAAAVAALPSTGD
jgi:M6 family metalloprotease-like protein